MLNKVLSIQKVNIHKQRGRMASSMSCTPLWNVWRNTLSPVTCFIVGTFSSSSSTSSKSSQNSSILPQKEDLRQFNAADKIFMKACRFIDHLQLL